ncbi:septum site-determining protein MinC [Pseudochelatococcus contaminans]|uniref:Probable septum site-determining protein MinC n=1 Tax=Pseudochelatococcus contaminans TaxID=1538103 RepID=A0A7W5Z368_9HYPH|nr:septum site-determining protein MinC [Pseudochelatococcus contaminans]
MTQTATPPAAQPGQAKRPTIRFRGRSFLALLLSPEAPLDIWFEELTSLIDRSPGFFGARAVILDVSGLDIDRQGLIDLLAQLGERRIQVMGIEGAKETWLGPGFPPLVRGGKQVNEVDVPVPAAKADDGSATQPAPAQNASGQGNSEQGTGTQDASAQQSQPAPISIPAETTRPSLIIEQPVRSGQSVTFPQGDVTIIGSVASGSEVIAGGSIHIYGALRGRALAGCAGHASARIFCNKLEAELVAIDGLYKTAEALDDNYRGQAVQIWLEGDAIKIAPIN